MRDLGVLGGAGVHDLGLFVPSRGRPRNIARLWEAMQATCQADTVLLVGLDADDPARDDYPAGPRYVVQDGLRYVTAWVNYLAVATLGEFAAIGTIGDDNIPETPGWDTGIISALDRQPFAFANDLYPLREPGALSCHIFMRPDVVRALGYFGPPETSHMYVDVAWKAWCISCGFEYLHDVYIRHAHYTTGQAALDETYRRSAARAQPDFEAWHAYSRRHGEYRPGLSDDMEKLGGKPFTADTLKRFNASLSIPEEWPW